MSTIVSLTVLQKEPRAHPLTTPYFLLGHEIAEMRGRGDRDVAIKHLKGQIKI